MSNKSRRPQTDPSNSPHKPSGEKESTKRHVWIESGVQIELAESFRKKYEASQKQADTHNEKMLWWTKAGAGLVFIYVLLTSGLFLLTRKSVESNTQQFQIDQRPYIWDSNVTDPTNVKIEAGQKMWVNISLINFGKAPALNARGVAKIFIGDNAMKDADDWFAAIGNKALPQDPADTGIVVPPGIPSGEITAKSAFGGGGYFTAMSDKVLTQDDVNYILHSSEKIAIVVHTEYLDAYGTRYWSNFCLSRFDTGTFPHCKTHNEMR